MLCLVPLIVSSYKRKTKPKGTIAHGIQTAIAADSNPASMGDAAQVVPAPDWGPAIQLAQDHRASLFRPTGQARNQRLRRFAIGTNTAAAETTNKAPIAEEPSPEGSDKGASWLESPEYRAAQSFKPKLSATRGPIKINPDGDARIRLGGSQEHGGSATAGEHSAQEFNRERDGGNQSGSQHWQFDDPGPASHAILPSVEHTADSQRENPERRREADRRIGMPRGHPTGPSDPGPFLVGEETVWEEDGSEVRNVSRIITIVEVADRDAK
jgi:hypothetical protein